MLPADLAALVGRWQAEAQQQRATARRFSADGCSYEEIVAGLLERCSREAMEAMGGKPLSRRCRGCGRPFLTFDARQWTCDTCGCLTDWPPRKKQAWTKYRKRGGSLDRGAWEARYAPFPEKRPLRAPR